MSTFPVSAIVLSGRGLRRSAGRSEIYLLDGWRDGGLRIGGLVWHLKAFYEWMEWSEKGKELFYVK